MMFKSFFLPAISALLLLYGCVDVSNHTDPAPTAPIVVTINPEGVPLEATGVVVTDNPTQTMSFIETKNLKVGTLLKLRLNRTGSEVKEYFVKYDGTYEMNGEHLIFCTTSNKLIIGQGDSGSPLLTSDGRVVGALCYGFSFANNQFAARAIEDMLTIAGTNTSSDLANNGSNLYKEIGLVNYAFGINEKYFERYSNRRNLFSSANTQFLKRESASLKSTSTSIIPGNSIAVNVISGDSYTMGAIGTLSHITENNKYLAFGHEFGTQLRSAPTTTANMVTMINSTQVAFKMAMPTNQAIGCMINDTKNGILIDPNATPQVFNHHVSLTLNGALAQELGPNLSFNHTIANFTNFEDDNYYSTMIVAMILADQVIAKGHNSLQATCDVNVNFSNSPAYYATLNVKNANGWLDFDIYRALHDSINSHLKSVKNQNITNFKINMVVAEYDTTAIQFIPHVE